MRKLIALILIYPFAISAQKNHFSLLDKYMQAQVDVNGFGGTVLVAKNGNIIYKKAFGMADMEWNVPNTIHSRFKIASLTKQFTAVCILQLQEMGKLTLQDKLSKYFPDFPKGDSVTIHMMLNHTSGIVGFTNLPEFPKVWSLPLEKRFCCILICKQTL